MVRSDEDCMRVALEEAKHALEHNWIPVGAVFVRDGQIIGTGRKRGIGHVRFDHAECNGCRDLLDVLDAPKTLEGVTVYATLEPCHMCLTTLMTVRVSRIVYGLEDPYGGASLLLLRQDLLPPRFRNDAPTIQGGVLEKESALLLKEFFQKPRGEDAYWTDMNNPLVQHALARAS